MQFHLSLGFLLVLSILLSSTMAKPLPTAGGLGSIFGKAIVDGLAAGAQDAWGKSRQDAVTAEDAASTSTATSAWSLKKDSP